MDDDMLHEWQTFCRSALRTRLMHRMNKSDFCDSDVCVFVFNRNGNCIVFDREWVIWTIRNNLLSSMYALSMLDDSNPIDSIDALPNTHMALVYDSKCSECQSAMCEWKCDKYRHVIPLANTNLDESCVVRRDNEMLRQFKL